MLDVVPRRASLPTCLPATRKMLTSQPRKYRDRPVGARRQRGSHCERHDARWADRGCPGRVAANDGEGAGEPHLHLAAVSSHEKQGVREPHRRGVPRLAALSCSPTCRRNPVGRLMDQIASELAFHPDLFLPLLATHGVDLGEPSLSAMIAFRDAALPFASLQATLIAILRDSPRPCTIVEARDELKASEQRGVAQGRAAPPRASAADPPRGDDDAQLRGGAAEVLHPLLDTCPKVVGDPTRARWRPRARKGAEPREPLVLGVAGRETREPRSGGRSHAGRSRAGARARQAGQRTMRFLRARAAKTASDSTHAGRGALRHSTQRTQLSTVDP